MVGHGLEHVLQELPGCASVSFFNKLRDRELARAITADEEIELALGGLHLGDIDVKESDRIALELLPLRLVAAEIRQARDPMALQTAVKG